MAKEKIGSAENLMRIGLALIFISLALLKGAVFGAESALYFWSAVIILFFETFKLPSVSAANATAAQAILTAMLLVAGGRGLIMSSGRSFNAYHFYLILLIIGALVMGFATFKRFFPAGRK